jgi:hypothetical protein
MADPERHERNERPRASLALPSLLLGGLLNQLAAG